MEEPRVQKLKAYAKSLDSRLTNIERLLAKNTAKLDMIVDALIQTRQSLSLNEKAADRVHIRADRVHIRAGRSFRPPA
jgi:hypothetical protein